MWYLRLPVMFAIKFSANKMYYQTVILTCGMTHYETYMQKPVLEIWYTITLKEFVIFLNTPITNSTLGFKQNGG